MHTSADILIVDDSPSNLQVLAEILHNKGYKVRAALSGEIALRAVVSQVPDLILLDIRMPDMDGYETCTRLKANAQTRDIPVLFISAMNQISDKLRAFEVGAVDYITKPFQAEEVLARVQTQTDLSNTRKALAESNVQLRAMMEQMVQSEKLKSLGFLAAGVAHELNTPIGNAFLVADTMETMARNYIQAQATGATSPSMEDLIATCTEGAPFILSNLQRANTLIQSLKEVSVDQASERRRSVQLRDVVNDIVALLGTRFKKTPYTFTVDIDPEITLDTYPGHLDQILENLVQNAIAHGFDGAQSGHIHLSATQVAQDRIALVVADNGKGIAPEHLSKVFDPFFTTKLGQGGSGLGLHIAYTLATGILGGGISVASTFGAGAEFTLVLPRVAPEVNNS